MSANHKKTSKYEKNFLFFRSTSLIFGSKPFVKPGRFEIDDSYDAEKIDVILKAIPFSRCFTFKNFEKTTDNDYYEPMILTIYVRKNCNF